MCDKLKEYFKKKDDLQAFGVNTDFINKNIGTIHTFQGKEADTVILCMNADNAKIGGLNYVNSVPNILNVAVTRAKSNLLVIGDYTFWKNAVYNANQELNKQLNMSLM